MSNSFVIKLLNNSSRKFKFLTHPRRLIIELDGPIHDYRKEVDKDRDAKLKSKGFFVKRIKNEELSDINNVIEIVREIIKSCNPSI